MVIKNTRAKIRLTSSQIHQMLELPEGLQVLAVQGQFDPPAVVVVVVHGDHLAEVPEDAELPYLRGHLTQESVEIDGKVFSRWSLLDYS